MPIVWLEGLYPISLAVNNIELDLSKVNPHRSNVRMEPSCSQIFLYKIQDEFITEVGHFRSF